MAKSTTAEAKTAASPGDNLRVVRETIESVVIAFILAFLFKTFEAEMFVIPTGSMAPTLLGRNKDLQCPECGYRYHASASHEVDSVTGEPIGRDVRGTTCPMCRFPLDFGATENPSDWRFQSYNGDRIVVGKFVFDLGEPQRWDVTVFKYPKDAKINYIKRLVGLPHEELQVEGGDIYTRHEGDDKFQIQRKPPHKVRAMLQAVYDNDYVVDKLIEAGWPARWQDWSATPRAGGWQNFESERDGKILLDRKAFAIEGQPGREPGERWLRYRHFTPDANVWQAFQAQTALPPARADLIRDFYAYNSESPPEPGVENNVNPVRDLALECEVETSAAQGEFVLELVKWDRKFQCHFDLQAGDAKLSISGLEAFHPVAKNAMMAGKHRLLFANVDCQLLVWLDDKLLDFDPSDTSYAPLASPPSGDPPAAIPGGDGVTDYSPVGIASVGASVTVGHLRILRDVYYTNASGFTSQKLGADQFMMMGDNSPASADSRYWGAVDRKLLTGKALFIYWPHSFDHTSPNGGMWFPFFPNFARMHRVR